MLLCNLLLPLQVHERDKDTDFCLLIVRKLLRTNSPHVKVILMSATFETAYFASYFSVQLSGSIVLPPVIKVEGTPFPVHEFHLDDIKHLAEVRKCSCVGPCMSLSVRCGGPRGWSCIQNHHPS